MRYRGTKITKREILASISIIAFMVLIGISISNSISEYHMEKNEIYNTAIQIDSPELFKHCMDTSTGKAFVYGDIEAVETVTFPEIGGEYIYVKKVEERYERHERIVTKEDADGNEYTEVEVYYEWDHQKTDQKYVENIKFCNIIFPYEKIILPSPDYIETIKGDKVYSYKSGERVKVRFLYYGIGTKYTGTIFTDLRNGTISDNTKFYNNKDIQTTLDQLNSIEDLVLFVFWSVWIFIIILIVIGFYYQENEWLEDNK